MEEGGRLAEVTSWAEAEFVRKMGKGWVAAEEKGESLTSSFRVCICTVVRVLHTFTKDQHEKKMFFKRC